MIPPEHLEWAPRPGALSFGDLLRHLGAIERYMFAENARVVAGALLASTVAVLTTWMNSQAERVRDETSFFRQERREVYSQFLRIEYH